MFQDQGGNLVLEVVMVKEEVNCRVGRNDRQGNDGMGYEVDREVNQKEVESPR